MDPKAGDVKFIDYAGKRIQDGFICLIKDKHEKGTALFTSQFPVSERYSRSSIMEFLERNRKSLDRF